MKKNTATAPTGHPIDIVDDPMTEVLRSGAQRLLVEAIEAEAEAFLALMASSPPSVTARSGPKARCQRQPPS